MIDVVHPPILLQPGTTAVRERPGGGERHCRRLIEDLDLAGGVLDRNIQRLGDGIDLVLQLLRLRDTEAAVRLVQQGRGELHLGRLLRVGESRLREERLRDLRAAIDGVVHVPSTKHVEPAARRHELDLLIDRVAHLVSHRPVDEAFLREHVVDAGHYLALARQP